MFRHHNGMVGKTKSKWTFNRQDKKYETGLFTFPSKVEGDLSEFEKPVKLIKKLISIHSNRFST